MPIPSLIISLFQMSGVSPVPLTSPLSYEYWAMLIPPTLRKLKKIIKSWKSCWSRVVATYLDFCRSASISSSVSPVAFWYASKRLLKLIWAALSKQWFYLRTLSSAEFAQTAATKTKIRFFIFDWLRFLAWTGIYKATHKLLCCWLGI